MKKKILDWVEPVNGPVEEVKGTSNIPIVESMNLSPDHKRALSETLTRLGYAIRPDKVLAILGVKAFVVLNGLYVNATGLAVGGDKGFPLLEAYQNAAKLEADKKV